MIFWPEDSGYSTRGPSAQADAGGYDYVIGCCLGFFGVISMTATTHTHCDYCSRPITQDPRATNKRFCCAKHRQAWHGEQRAKAMALLRKQETGKEQAGGK